MPEDVRYSVKSAAAVPKIGCSESVSEDVGKDPIRHFPTDESDFAGLILLSVYLREWKAPLARTCTTRPLKNKVHTTGSVSFRSPEINEFD
ncbi:unnamed protein product [Didymodactylos carnosus]|uniref:Uncharacterized protein n=1 Tax=Didymodactylos carnosus TaxID=1234261 RepID=A0A815SFW7_9BILA|nr:unnamed protein product [Didymodactylos carnosus]CAF4354459.1 unnamed protein product [Didymodactylos carnosus]